MSGPADLRIPIVEEQAHVARRAVETGRVRVRTEVDLHEELVTATLAVEALEVERRPVERAVPTAPPPRRRVTPPSSPSSRSAWSSPGSSTSWRR